MREEEKRQKTQIVDRKLGIRVRIRALDDVRSFSLAQVTHLYAHYRSTTGKPGSTGSFGKRARRRRPRTKRDATFFDVFFLRSLVNTHRHTHTNKTHTDTDTNNPCVIHTKISRKFGTPVSLVLRTMRRSGRRRNAPGRFGDYNNMSRMEPVSYTHLRAHET